MSNKKESLKKYITTDNKSYVYASDKINGALFHLYHFNKGYVVALFSDGSYQEVDIDTETGLGSFTIDGEEYNIRNPIIAPDGDISRPSDDIIEMFEENKIPDIGIYQELCDLLHDYYDFYSDDELHYIATHIIHTYLLSAIGRCFYILLDGDAGTGKSSLQILMSKLQYNGIFTGKTTMPAMIRELDSRQASINIDEFDKSSDEERRNSTGILNTGYMKHGTYKIVDTNKKDVNKQVKSFHTFGAKSFSVNRNLFDSSLLSRCVTINTVTNTREIKNINSLEPSDIERFQDMRNKLFIYCLFNWKGIVESISEAKTNLSKSDLFGRSADINSIIVGINKHFTGKDDLSVSLMSRAEVDAEMAKDEDRKYQVYSYIIKHIDIESDYTELSATEIADYINDELGLDPFDKYKATGKSVGKSLKSFRVVDSTSRSRKVTTGCNRGSRLWVVRTSNLKDVLLRCSYVDIKAELRTKMDTLSKRHNATDSIQSQL